MIKLAEPAPPFAFIGDGGILIYFINGQDDRNNQDTLTARSQNPVKLAECLFIVINVLKNVRAYEKVNGRVTVDIHVHDVNDIINVVPQQICRYVRNTIRKFGNQLPNES